MRKLLFVLLIAIMPLVSSCRLLQPSDIDAMENAVQVIAGEEFNKFFPEATEGFDLVYTQEKEGFAQAKLNQDGAEVATLSVSDIANNPDSAAKYENSSMEIAGYPAAAIGNQGTGILVGGRIQVQIRSKSDTFTEDDRIAWLEQFNLDGFAGLQ